MRTHNEVAITAPRIAQPLRWLAISTVAAYYRIPYRIRAWGRLPHRRGPTLVISNHQHEVESPVIVADLTVRSFSWKYPIFTVSSRRMWEPGFLAQRIPWLRVLRGVNLGWLFSAIGMQPIENELHTRPLVSLAFHLTARHGDILLADVFKERVAAFPANVTSLREVLSPRHFALSRSEALAEMRAEIERDITHFERLQRDGATIFLTPEGSYSGDGKMQRLRGILSRLAPLAQVWLAAISYEPYAHRRLSLLYRVQQAQAGRAFDLQLKGARPVTPSAIACSWIVAHPGSFTREHLVSGARAELERLPAHALVVPELRSRVDSTIDNVLAGMLRLGTLQRIGDAYELTQARTHPQFPRTADMVAYQANFHAETLAGL
jgi:1-acyl-sn-glycerol-3-phosphate acyltransferase